MSKTLKMPNEINQENNQNTKSNLEIKLQNDIIAFKKVVKWAKTIRNRIETTLQKLDSIESNKQSKTNQLVINNSTNLDGKLQENVQNSNNQTN